MNINQAAKKKIEQLKKGEISPLEFAKFLSDPIVTVEDRDSQFYGKPMVNNNLLTEIIRLIAVERNEPEFLSKLEEVRRLFLEKAVKNPVNSTSLTEGNATAIEILLALV